MKLIKFPLSNTKGKEISLPNNTTLTDNIENVIPSLPYQDWEIEEIIENLSENEQDALIEKISDQVQEWELTLDAKLELWLQTKHKESKGNISYIDFLYDLAQEQVYRAYAIEQLDKQRGKVSISDKKGNQSLAASNTHNPSITAATPTNSTTLINSDSLVDSDASTNQLNINNNSLLNDEEQQINQIIEKLSEDEQDALMEKSVFLFDQWVSTTDVGLELALKREHQKSQPNIPGSDKNVMLRNNLFRLQPLLILRFWTILNKRSALHFAHYHIPYQDFLYELAQSQVYREYATEQIELAKQSSFAFIEPFTQIEKVYCDKANSVDELTFDEPVFNNVSQGINDKTDVQLLDANDDTIINNDGLATSSDDAFIREEPIFDDVSRSAKENAVNKRTNLDCHQWDIGNNQGYRERITSSKDCADYHITGALPKGCNFSIKFIISGQTRYLSLRPNSKNSLSLINVHKILLMPINQGKLTSFHHPPSLPP